MKTAGESAQAPVQAGLAAWVKFSFFLVKLLFYRYLHKVPGLLSEVNDYPISLGAGLEPATELINPEDHGK